MSDENSGGGQRMTNTQSVHEDLPLGPKSAGVRKMKASKRNARHFPSSSSLPFPSSVSPTPSEDTDSPEGIYPVQVIRDWLDLLAGKCSAVSARQESLDSRLRTLERHLVSFLNDYRASKNVARPGNLIPLMSFRTGQEIPYCPTTILAIYDLDPAVATHILEELEQPVPISDDDKRRAIMRLVQGSHI
ncbi:hypothetical protein VTK73DRAFT_4688 [Phialemonium thermophilum]|uniref:Uncharacterized protein n=1 Tax=Phialemonium thermophilum TaxID=223376 RepID=A0ABR3WS14_9PEZI